MAEPFETDDTFEDDEDLNAPEGPTRKDRRQERYDDLQRKLDEQTARSERLEQQLSQVTTHLQTQGQQNQSKSALDEAQAEYDRIYKEREQLADAANSLDPKAADFQTKLDGFRQRARDLEAEQYDARAKVRELKNAPPPEDPQARASREQYERLAAQHPDVLRHNVDAQRLFVSKATAAAVKDKSWRLTDEAAGVLAEEVRRDLQMGQHRGGHDPSPSQQRTSEGMPAGGGPGGGSATTPERNDVNLSLAAAAHPDLSEEEAWKRWLADIKYVLKRQQ